MTNNGTDYSKIVEEFANSEDPTYATLDYLIKIAPEKQKRAKEGIWYATRSRICEISEKKYSENGIIPMANLDSINTRELSTEEICTINIEIGELTKNYTAIQNGIDEFKKESLEASLQQ